MLRTLRFATSLFFLLSSVLLFADQVFLKNGDRITGTIVKSDDKVLDIKTEFAGEVNVQWPAVSRILSSQPLHVQLKNGKTIVGSIDAANGHVDVTTASQGLVTSQQSEVMALRNDAEQKAFEKSLHPSLLQGWTGGTTIGFGLTGGNSQTENLAIAFNADRKTSHDEITAYENSVYSRDNAPGASPAITANTTQGGARYAHNLTKRLFAFGSGDFQSDALQALNLRSILGGGLGWHLINNKQTAFDVLGGLNYTNENYVGLSRNFAALTLGEELTQKLGASTVLSEKGYVFPDLSQTGQYNATFNIGTITKISKWLGWQNAFGDIYVTDPLPGKKDNDLLFTTGLNIAFKR